MIFFIKNLGLTLCCIFYYVKLLHLTSPKHFSIQVSIFSVLLSLFSIFSELYFPYYTFILQIILTVFFLHYTIHISFPVSVTATTIAFTLSYVTLFIASMITGFYHMIFFYPKKALPLQIQISSCVLQLLIMLFPFHIRRWKKGMPFLYKETCAFPGMVISFFTILLATAILYIKEHNISSLSILLIILALFLSLAIYYYWQSNLTKTYRDKLKEREIEEQNKTISSQSETITELKNEVVRLSRIIHKDNSLIPEYSYILRTFLSSNLISEKDTLLSGRQLLERLDKLTEERKGIIHQQDVHCRQIPSTKVFCIDTLLTYKQQAALKENIDLEIYISCDITYLTKEIISQDDLHTLLTYLLDNAIIASKHNDGRHIMLSINIIAGAYTVSVFDSGIPFTTEVIEKWGLVQITTHQQDGGSGIGMMTIYEIAKKYNASFIIDELKSENRIYTKRLTVSFDQRNQYILQTTRADEELAELAHRTDLQIIK